MEKEKLRNAGVEEAGQGRVFLKLSGALMCLCPAESKEIENVSVVPGGLQRHMWEQQTERTERGKVKQRAREVWSKLKLLVLILIFVINHLRMASWRTT